MSARRSRWGGPATVSTRTHRAGAVRAQLAELLGPALDPTTAAIARQLCPAADTCAAATRLPAASVDLMVGNVPFGEIVLHDPVQHRLLLAPQPQCGRPAATRDPPVSQPAAISVPRPAGRAR